MKNLPDSITLLEPLNLSSGWFVQYNNLTEASREKSALNTQLIKLINARHHSAVEIMKGHDDYFIHVYDIHDSQKLIDTIEVKERDQLVKELEWIVWKIGTFDSRIYSFEGPHDFLRLRIPEGWKVAYNKLINIDPDQLEEDSDEWFHFTSSLLLLEHKENQLLLDVGWYVDIEPSGTFYILLIKNQDWENPLEDVEMRRPEELVSQIEAILQKAAVQHFE
ncbi:hypothetical protein OZL92_02965 [Bacillus sonorensis]|uniref:hypothetical protein n=1 Tax=Bacillus TaxID=1386 RepID=UPI001F1E6C91|nr:MULTISPECIES: hypothetical protein [Bacillus]MCF7617769.1 hypothetical protein [Bacillus sonorensis]MCY7856488.1 hypothetical protein [Bacillus sonorensis]MCY8269581.1 hypothetical protein [Bacillus sonorensis]MCY8404897.1 hypothetical protein [Bacillus sonorensis]MCY8561379.1 hypothetical protein [Bacillus sonorensis]